MLKSRHCLGLGVRWGRGFGLGGGVGVGGRLCTGRDKGWKGIV